LKTILDLIDLLLVLINTVSLSGCILIKPDGTAVNLMTVIGSSMYEGSAQISDDESPGLLYTYKTDGITNFDPGM
jgi:hypothetical protein